MQNTACTECGGRAVATVKRQGKWAGDLCAECLACAKGEAPCGMGEACGCAEYMQGTEVAPQPGVN